jgi:hypothetical protein
VWPHCCRQMGAGAGACVWWPGRGASAGKEIGGLSCRGPCASQRPPLALVPPAPCVSPAPPMALFSIALKNQFLAGVDEQAAPSALPGESTMYATCSCGLDVRHLFLFQGQTCHSEVLVSLKKNSRLRRRTKKTPDLVVSRGGLSNGVFLFFRVALWSKKQGT